MIISTCKFIFTKLILADKPTVDSQNGKEVMDLLKEQDQSVSALIVPKSGTLGAK